VNVLSFLILLSDDDEAKPGNTHWFLLTLISLTALLLFYMGYRRITQWLRIRKISEVSIGNLSPGFVRIFGKVEGSDPLKSPLTESACYYYNSVVQKLAGKGRKQNWTTVKQKTERRNFYLNDGTGRVLIDLLGAEIDATKALSAQIKPDSTISFKQDKALAAPEPTEAQLWSMIGPGWEKVTPAEEPAPESAAPEAAEPGKKGWLRGLKKMPINIEGLGGVTLARSEEGGWEIEDVDVEGLGKFSSGDGPAGAYTIDETCLLVGEQYSVLGTCVPGQGETPLVIARDPKQKTLLVSAERGERLTRKLLKEGILLILGGVLVAVFAIWFSLNNWTTVQ